MPGFLSELLYADDAVLVAERKDKSDRNVSRSNDVCRRRRKY